MAYTDQEMRNFTQIAYADLTKGYEKLCAENPGVTSFSIESLKKASLEAGVPKSKLKQLDCLTDSQLKEWKISGIHDTNSKNGFYGCIIETGPGEAAVGFRGSESMGSLDNVVNDWVGADVGLVNSTCTNQQAEVERFLAKYQNQLNGYDSLAMSGHSLGGNLAEYATIVSNKYGLNDNIKQCMSMDGPGFSDEFIAKYRKEIEAMSSVMKHPRWSFVGTMLNDLPGVDYEYVKVSNDANTEDNEDYTAITRHSTKYLEYDESGNLIVSEQDGLSKVTSIISEGMDHLPSVIGNVVISTICTVWIGAMWFKENLMDENGLTTAGWLTVGGIIAASVVIGFPTVISTIFTTVVAIVAVVLVSAVLEVARDVIEHVVNWICDGVGQFLNWSKEKIKDLYNSVVDTLRKARDWWNKNFNSGYKYATSNPYIVINTTTMDSYAKQLRTLSKRAKILDGKMNSLYWHLGIEWDTIANLGRLLKAEFVLDYAYRLDKCANYLSDTARDFDAVERDLQGIC